MDWDRIKTVLIEEWASISDAPFFHVLAMLFALGAASLAVWLILSLRYVGMLSSLRSRLKAADERSGLFEREFPGRTPAQVATRLRRLEEHVASLPPRRLSEAQRQMITAAGPPPISASYLAITHDSVSQEVARYARDLVEAYGAAPGWNLVEEAYPIAPHPLGVGLAVGTADQTRPTPTERLVMQALAAAGVTYELVPKATAGADVEIVVSGR